VLRQFIRVHAHFSSRFLHGKRLSSTHVLHRPGSVGCGACVQALPQWLPLM